MILIPSKTTILIIESIYFNNYAAKRYTTKKNLVCPKKCIRKTHESPLKNDIDGFKPSNSYVLDLTVTGFKSALEIKTGKKVPTWIVVHQGDVITGSAMMTKFL